MGVEFPEKMHYNVTLKWPVRHHYAVLDNSITQTYKYIHGLFRIHKNKLHTALVKHMH